MQSNKRNQPRNLFAAILLISHLFINGQTVSTFAGSGTIGYVDGTGTEAQFYYPKGIAVDLAGNVFVADNENRLIRKITVDGMVTTFAGSGEYGFADGQGTAAQFAFPQNLAVDASGNLYITDAHRIRKITANGVVSTLAGQADSGNEDGEGINAKFHNPIGIDVDAAGTVFVADFFNERIRKITPAGVVTTLAGSSQGYEDGIGTSAKFDNPTSVAVSSNGSVYVTDGENNRIRKITVDGIVTTVAGSSYGYADGMGTAAQFAYPYDLDIDDAQNLYIADTYNQRIRVISPLGMVSTLAGSVQGYVDGVGAEAQFYNPVSLARNSDGDIYVADPINNVIRKITGVLSTSGYQFHDPISVYPNPTSSIVHIEFNNLPAQLTLYDLGGRSIHTIDITEFTTTLDINNLSNGLYLLKIISGNGTFSKKIVKQ